MPGGQICFPDPIWRVLTRYDFEAWFKASIQNLGLEPSLYSLHTFCTGGIQKLLLAEPNTTLSQGVTDHDSDAIWVYADVLPERRLGCVHETCF